MPSSVQRVSPQDLVGAVERRGAQLGQTERFLAEVGIDLRVEVFVLALARGKERLFRRAFESQLVCPARRACRPSGCSRPRRTAPSRARSIRPPSPARRRGRRLRDSRWSSSRRVQAVDVVLPVRIPNLMPVALPFRTLGRRVHHKVVRSALVVEAAPAGSTRRNGWELKK